MRCEQARQALTDDRYGSEISPELSAHLADCDACRGARAREVALDRWLALDEPAVARPGFDTRFFAHLQAEKTRTRRRRWTRLGWALLPLAAGAAVVLLRPTFLLPRAPDRGATQVPADDLKLAMELDLVENIEVAQKLDEVEAYDVISQLDEGELERIVQEGK